VTAGRTLIGKWTSAISRVRVYELPDSLEVESNEQFEVTRRRVFFDDVQLVTYHRRRGIPYLLVMGTLAALSNGLILVGFILDRSTGVAFLVTFGLVAIPSLIAFLIRAIWGLDIITVYGRRSKAAVRFRLKKQRAREVYGHICALVRETQRRKAEEYAAETFTPSPAEESSEPPLPPEPPPQ
jgi:uncharacterized integral membrane protein